MDTARRRALPARTGTPSMEPRPFSHGYDKLRRLNRKQRIPFNGATTFQPWIPFQSTGLTNLELTLQWSHDLSAMDTNPRAWPAPMPTVLQWSHDLSAMDTRQTGCLSDLCFFPSMEPRPFSHGYLEQLARFEAG